MKHERYILPGCLLAAAVLYLPSLGNYMVADSWVFMVPHSFFGTFAYFVKTMLPPEFNALWLRPVPMFTYWLDTVLWSGTSWGPHLVNMLFHLVNTALVWHIVRNMSSSGTGNNRGDTLAAAVACLVYAVHPLTVGSVGWVAARFDVMCVTFGLAGMYLWLRRETGASGGKYLAGGVALLVLSLLSKEQGIVYSAACVCASCYTAVVSKKDRRRSVTGIAVISAIICVYIVYRLIVFKGIGGYLESRHGLSVMPPLYYLLALFYPYPNVFPNAGFSLTMLLSAVIVVATGVLLLRNGQIETKKVPPVFFLASLLLCLFGLTTNAPNPGMELDRVLGHAESRFALNALTGLALAAGAAVSYHARSRMARRALIAVVMLWSVIAVWRTDVQIQAWRDAGSAARGIVEDTVRLAPEPPFKSKMIFFDIPRNNDQWAYIFGIGLREALILRYGRSDIDVIRYPKREDLRSALPDRDFVFTYNARSGRLERLTAQRQKRE